MVIHVLPSCLAKLRVGHGLLLLNLVVQITKLALEKLDDFVQACFQRSHLVFILQWNRPLVDIACRVIEHIEAKVRGKDFCLAAEVHLKHKIPKPEGHRSNYDAMDLR